MPVDRSEVEDASDELSLRMPEGFDQPFNTTWLYKKVHSFVQEYMARYDMSHDFNHIRRVAALADKIHARECRESRSGSPTYRHGLIQCAALLHDVGDRKYAQDNEDSDQVILDLLKTSNEDQWHPNFAQNVLTIVKNVSYSNEMKRPDHVLDMLKEYPELGVVQDADRLDAIGAVGIARCFAYGAAKAPDRGLQGSINHFGEKLEKLESMMKTKTGRELAKQRTERIREFREWWMDETSMVAEADARY